MRKCAISKPIQLKTVISCRSFFWVTVADECTSFYLICLPDHWNSCLVQFCPSRSTKQTQPHQSFKSTKKAERKIRYTEKSDSTQRESAKHTFSKCRQQNGRHKSGGRSNSEHISYRPSADNSTSWASSSSSPSSAVVAVEGIWQTGRQSRYNGQLLT